MTSPSQLLQTLDLTHRRTMALIDDLSDEQLDVPYERGINPPIWELGHAAFFYEFFLLRNLYGIDPIMPGFDPVWDSFDIPHKERWSPGVVPDKKTTLEYYNRVVNETRDRLASRNYLSDEELYLGQYVIAHQCMHLESLIWCRQTLGYQPPPYSELLPSTKDAPVIPRDITIPGGTYFIGVPTPDPDNKAKNFSFDNERPGFGKHIDTFSISPTLVTHGEFLAFVEDGGYKNKNHWSFGGQYWLRQQDRTHPRYWEKRDGEWTVRRFDCIENLDPATPLLHISFWEAEAYCHWAGRRLPTEFEWEAAARGLDAHKYPWGFDPKESPGDLDARHLGTAPATAFPEHACPNGCLQMIGTAWEWTTSQYLPYDGFSVDMYAYMSTLQFGDHKTTRGGSCATSSYIIRNTYRQAYHPDRCDVFTGFRTCGI
ncbi:MAG: hypothetical protein CMO55_05485 [Verrucomicrobiales bacterium]|nr:hypothetical protein [Verrucomicrobiales bacterium]